MKTPKELLTKLCILSTILKWTRDRARGYKLSKTYNSKKPPEVIVPKLTTQADRADEYIDSTQFYHVSPSIMQEMYRRYGITFF